MTTILVRVPRGALARWMLWLADALAARPGTTVALAIDGGAEASSALATLLSLERMVLRRGRESGGDRLSPADFARFTANDAARPDLVIDLRDDAAAVADAVVLRPTYDGHPGESAMAGALFFTGTPRIAIERLSTGGDPVVVAGGTASLEAASGIGGGIEAVGSRVATLIVKALDAPLAIAAPAPDQPVRAIGRGDVAARMARAVARQAVHAAYRLCCHPSHWRVGWRFPTPGNDVWSRRELGTGWSVLADPVDHFYADPFPFHRDGRDHLFFEDLDNRTGKGVIAVATFDEAGRPGPTRTVLEEPFHLSYPFLIARGGEVFMIPEGSLGGQIVLYRAIDFPLRWERHAVLVDGVEAADATVVEHGGRLWMFAVTRAGVGGYSDTLAIWSAARLEGPWKPHAGNPVLVDDRAARAAGHFVRRDGVLYRPAQDCRDGYGAAIRLMRVDRLDDEAFAQTHVATLHAGAPGWPGRRVHTLNFDGRLEAIDGLVPRPKLKFLADRVDDWYRPE